MFDLTATKLLITLEATETIALDQYAGSSLRGALYEAMLRRFCMNREATSCADCPLNATCPVAGLVAPLRDERPRGRDAPRPFVIAADPAAIGLTDAESRNGEGAYGRARTEVRLEVGQTYTFAVTLFGRAATFFPYLALSLPTVATIGIGRPLRDHHGQRGRPRIAKIDVVQPFTGQRETLYLANDQAVRTPTLVITPDMIATHAATLPTDRLAVRFITPTRLIAGKRLMAHPDARTLALRLTERLEALEQEYGGSSSATNDQHAAKDSRRDRYIAVERIARDICVVADETRWVDVTSYSSRQGQSMPIGGFRGRAILEGNIGPLRELLVWGEVAHAGKNAVKGDGCIRVESVPDTTVITDEKESRTARGAIALGI